MRKIYSLLFLGGLLLFGVESVMATDYYMKHGWMNTSSWYWQKLTADGEGGYYCYGLYGSTGGTTCGYNTEVNDGTATWNIAIYTASEIADGTFCKFTLYPEATTNKIVAAAEDYYTVTIKTNWNVPAYVWGHTGSADDGNKYNGEWPGTTGTTHSIKVPRNGHKILIIFSDGGSETKRFQFDAGHITDDLTLDFTLYAKDDAWDWFKLNKVYLRGDFNDWDSYDTFDANNEIAVDITKDESIVFRVVEGSNWWGYGQNSTVKEFTESEADFTLYSGQNNVKVTASVTGSYLLKWNTSNQKISVTYPTQLRTGLNVGDFGTVCLEKAAPADYFVGVEFYNIYGKNAATNPTELYLVKEEGNLVAGKPYIFKATASDLAVTLTGDAAASEGNNKGLYGTFTAKDADAMNAIVAAHPGQIYLLSGNQVVKAGSNCTLAANRAYIIMNDANLTVTDAPTGAPDRFIAVPLVENGATNINAIDASEEVVKFFQNGKLFIKKNGVVYDMMGAIVK